MSFSFSRLLWLRDNFSTITDVSSDDDIEFATRAFLLHLVGCTLFADKSATSVVVVYLELFRDLSMVYLYRQLTTVTMFEVRQLGGYLTLLQVRLMTLFDNF